MLVKNQQAEQQRLTGGQEQQDINEINGHAHPYLLISGPGSLTVMLIRVQSIDYF
jgi:hypothetical protein